MPWPALEARAAVTQLAGSLVGAGGNSDGTLLLQQPDLMEESQSHLQDGNRQPREGRASPGRRPPKAEVTCLLSFWAQVTVGVLACCLTLCGTAFLGMLLSK